MHGMIAASVASEQCRRLAAEGLTRMHVYALNRAELPLAIRQLLARRTRRWPPPERTDMSRFPRLRAPPRRALLDGAMGSQIQAPRPLARRLLGPGELLGDPEPQPARPDPRDPRAATSRAGADAVETNSFGGSPITLGEFGLEERALEINERAAGSPARRSRRFAGDGRERFVIGAIGPGTKLPSLGHIAYRELEEAFAVQAEGLIAGGADVLLIETCQDPLQIKAAVNGCRHAFVRRGRELPLMVQVTIETTGTMLVGTDIAAATAIVDALGVPVMGLNCATGPKEMAEHVRHLVADLARPDLVPAQCRPARAALRPHPLSARRRTSSPAGSSASSPRTAIAIVGGCCGTTAEHIAALDAMLRRTAEDGFRPRAEAARSRSTRPRSPRCSRPCRCARRTRSWPSASAAMPTARRSSASCRRPATGTAASPWAASRCARAATRSTSAPPSSAATRSPR